MCLVYGVLGTTSVVFKLQISQHHDRVAFCACSSHLFWRQSAHLSLNMVDASAGDTQEEGHTVSFLHEILVSGNNPFNTMTR